MQFKLFTVDLRLIRKQHLGSNMLTNMTLVNWRSQGLRNQNCSSHEERNLGRRNTLYHSKMGKS